MKPLPINLCVFDSTKGHFGRTDIYQKCVNNLFNQVPLNTFATKLVHIKVDANDEDQKSGTFKSMTKFYENLGFTIRYSYGSWSHFDKSHQKEYCKDLINIYGDPDVKLSGEYTLHLESDWLFHSYTDKTLVDHLIDGIRFLSENKGVLGLRFPRFLNEVERINNVNKKHPSIEKKISCVFGGSMPLDLNDLFFLNNDNLSLNPSLFRTRDLFILTNILDKTPELQDHVEMGFGKLFDWVSPTFYPFAIYNPENISVLHIGTPTEAEEDKAGQTFEKLVD